VEVCCCRYSIRTTSIHKDLRRVSNPLHIGDP
jgi:hypothetical protein